MSPDWLTLSTGRVSLVDAILAYEEDALTDEDVVVLFQRLLDGGLVDQLQGHYGRVAVALLDAGLIHRST